MRRSLQRAAAAFIVALFIAGATIASATIASGPVQAQVISGAVLVSTCFSCHGTDGKSAGAMPTIAGKSETYIIEKLKAFRSDEIEATIMNRIAKGFTDDEIAALAKFFSGK